jgi:hypothetical protein
MKLALVMIVKNEAATLPRLIASVREHIDTWTIIDTGSTDDTLAVIRRELAGIPGQLLERGWVDFGTNRTQALTAAQGTADYLLLMDADWTLNASPGAFEGLTADSYLVRHDDTTEFWNRRLVSGRMPWRFVGVVHEYIHADEPHTDERLSGVSITNHVDGGSREGRHERDLELLEAEVRRDPNDARAGFYLGQTLECLALNERAAAAYLHRAGMDGFDEETYVALLRAGRLLDDITILLRAWSLRPQRLEALYEVAHRLRAAGASHAGSRLLTGVSVSDMPSDVLFVDRWVWEYALPFECACAAQGVGDHRLARALYDELGANDRLPAAYRAAIAANAAALRADDASGAIVAAAGRKVR